MNLAENRLQRSQTHGRRQYAQSQGILKRRLSGGRQATRVPSECPRRTLITNPTTERRTKTVSREVKRMFGREPGLTPMAGTEVRQGFGAERPWFRPRQRVVSLRFSGCLDQSVDL